MARQQGERKPALGMVLLLGTSLTGCVGAIESEDIDGKRSGGAPAMSVGGAGTGGTGAGTGGTGGTVAFAAPSGGLRLLTNLEYANTIRDLVGSDIQVPSRVPVDADPDAERKAGFRSVAGMSLSLVKGAVSNVAQAAADLAGQAVAPARRSKIVGCLPSGPADTACATSFVKGFGRLAFRRPLEPAEERRYLDLLKNVAVDMNDFWGGVEMTLTAFLQSPAFLYRPELGAAGATAAAPRPVRGYEMASRLSYALAATTPSPALLDAAARGELDTPEGLRGHVQQLLGARGIEAAFAVLFDDWLELYGLEKKQHLTDDLKAAMRQETLMFLKEATRPGSKGGLASALVARTTYANDALAKHYGLPLPGSSQMKMVPLPPDGPRSGLLGQGSFLANHAADEEFNSPIFRGKALVERFLCRQLGDPIEDLKLECASRPTTARGRRASECRQEAPSCAGCHRVMDPLGLAFENFDRAGKYRAADMGLAIDPSGALDGKAFPDAPGLGRVLSENPDFAACVAKQFYRHATGRVGIAQDAELAILGRRFAEQGFDLSRLAAEMTADPIFTTVGGAQ